MNMIYFPTTTRRLIASSILISGFVLTLLVKIVRGRMAFGAPTWVMDSLPNCICGAVVPFAIMIGDRTIRYRDFLFFCILIVIGLTVYELLQLAMPNRTFEVNDVVASALGGLLPVSLGWLFFRHEVQSGEKTLD